MTGTLPQWSPLNDPALSQDVQARLHDQTEKVRIEAQRDLYFLQRYAWREYPVKCGRWHLITDPAALTAGTNVAGPWTKRVWTADLTWVTLFDPSSHQPLAMHLVNWWQEQRDGQHVYAVGSTTTSVWFAGDPRVCGMFTQIGNGHRTAFGYRRGFDTVATYLNWRAGPSHYEREAPSIVSKPFVDGISKEYGAWIADHPQPPENPKRFGFL